MSVQAKRGSTVTPAAGRERERNEQSGDGVRVRVHVHGEKGEGDREPWLRRSGHAHNSIRPRHPAGGAGGAAVLAYVTYTF